MAPISSTPSSNIELSARGGGWTPRLVVILIALIWPTQLLVTVGILGANANSSVAQEFHTTQVVWFGLIVTLISTLLTPFVIKLGDLYGKKRVMIVITALGVVGDIIAVTATSFPLLLIGRGVAAFYGPLPALSFPAVRDIFPKKLVKPASSILGSSLGLVALASPFLAGWLIDNWGYKGALWFMATATAVSLVLIVVVVPETPRHAFESGFDWIGGLVLGGGLAIISYALSECQTWGWTDSRTLIWTAVGVVFLVVFYFVEQHSPHPIIDLGVLRRRPVATVLASGAIGQAVSFVAPTIVIMLALYPSIPGVSGGLGWTSQHNAVVGASWNIVLFLTGIVASRFLGKGDPRRIWWFGLAMVAIGYFVVGFFHANAVELTWTMCIASFGSGLVVAASPVLVVNVVTADEQGLGSGMLNMLMNLAAVLFTSILFAALNSHSTVMEGTAFYLDAGYSWAFWSGALLALFALLISLFIPAPTQSDEPSAVAA